jgi:hypothetical protein
LRHCSWLLARQACALAYGCEKMLQPRASCPPNRCQQVGLTPLQLMRLPRPFAEGRGQGATSSITCTEGQPKRKRPISDRGGLGSLVVTAARPWQARAHTHTHTHTHTLRATFFNKRMKLWVALQKPRGQAAAAGGHTMLSAGETSCHGCNASR